MSTSPSRYTLPNGLLVILKEIHTTPIVSHWVWYRVGSRDETPGKTGASHWVEHMQFKGTSRFPAGVLDKAIARYGGVWNAFTYLDWTTYFETLPVDKIDLALELEADRMSNSLFNAAELEAERNVIINERQGNENEPLYRLGEAVQEAAFQVHPYRHEVIGELADLQTMARDDLYQHYRTYYTPNNAILSIAGDFETTPLLERLQQLYEDIPPGAPPPRQSLSEPPQDAERIVNVSGPGETCYIDICHRAPDANHPDFFPFVVLDSLLTGPSSLNMFGGGISNKTSRLYQALVEEEIAINVGGGLQSTLDPFLHSITVVLHPQSTPDQVIARVESEIQRLQDTPPSPEELARAVKQARALFAYGSESITNQAYWLGMAEILNISGEPQPLSWFDNYLPNLEKVTAQDVQRIAQTCLTPARRTVGTYLPNRDEIESEAGS